MSDTPEKSGKQHPDKDRRAHPRQRIHSLSYVKIGDGNGGIVLNISEGGISVQAAAVLEAGETLPIWLEIPKVRNRLEVQAEIVWLGASRKEAGLRFVDLEESTLRKIRKWMEREASPEKFEDEPEVVEEEDELPVQVAAAVVEAVPLPATTVAIDDSGVRELTQADVKSAEEIKIFESGRDPAETMDAADDAEETGEASEDAFEVMRGGEFDDETDEVEIVAAASEDDEVIAERFAAKSSEDADAEPVLESKADVEEEIEADAEAGDKFKLEPAGDEEHETDSDGEPETEDEVIAAFGPPVVPFERRPHTPFSSMNALASGGRVAQNLAVAPALSLGQAREAHATANETTTPNESVAKEPDWKDFRVQLHTGWFLAALVLLLALISFIAGMAVRRGALNQVLGEQQDSLLPKSSPVATVTPHNAAPGAVAPAGKPLLIEVVDLANHHWLVPASNGPNRAVASPTSDATTRAADDAPAGSPKLRDDTSAGAADPNTGKAKVPLVLNLPETPISASGSVAISAQRSVAVPADGSATQSGRNMQVGQLLNVVEPVYPPEAIKDRVEGTVKLHAVVGSDGSIQSLTALSGPKVLIDASLSAVHNWKYSPTRMGGQAIETEEDISFVFRLPN
jgi:outer membrane biosynthesis protein TonB/Tfp pilus assembly protein PilZ